MRANTYYIKRNSSVSLTCHDEIRSYTEDFDNEETHDWIREQLMSGNRWAWCWVSVDMAFMGLEGRATISGCSYESEVSFKHDAYYDALLDECAQEIADTLNALGLVHDLWEHDETTCLRCVARWGDVQGP